MPASDFAKEPRMNFHATCPMSLCGVQKKAPKIRKGAPEKIRY